MKKLDLSGKDYLTREESAHYCCVSVRAFLDLRKEHGLQHAVVRGKIVYRRKDLQQLMEAHFEWQRCANEVRSGTSASPTRTTRKIPGSKASAPPLRERLRQLSTPWN